MKMWLYICILQDGKSSPCYHVCCGNAVYVDLLLRNYFAKYPYFVCEWYDWLSFVEL